jgi:ABC-2 type transport system ATP-binding protein
MNAEIEQKIVESTYDKVGYLPVLYFVELRGKDPVEISPKTDEWLKRFDVKGNRKTKVKTLSKGNQQKVQLIVTFIHEPKFIILDEPFSGLDPC